jgi:hypothetical protein
MKEIIITSKRLKKELYFWLAAFGIAFILNVYSILKYHTRWIELFTQLGYLLAYSIVIYLVIGLFRCGLKLIKNKHKAH